eukprot:1498752-Pyramimonas_sp.AAC.1
MEDRTKTRCAQHVDVGLRSGVLSEVLSEVRVRLSVTLLKTLNHWGGERKLNNDDLTYHAVGF